MNKYIVVGLGNPDSEYDGTRHNMGFRIVDAVVDRISRESGEKLSFSSDRYAMKCEARIMGRPVIFLKPTTYMNLSGKAVKYWQDKEKVPVENIFIIVDDLALELGTIRLRYKGSDGGHNGLKNIIECLQTSKFNRMRFGIGNDFAQGRQVDFVLGKLSAEEEDRIKPQVDKAYDIIKSFVMVGMEKTMNAYNGK